MNDEPLIDPSEQRIHLIEPSDVLIRCVDSGKRISIAHARVERGDTVKIAVLSVEKKEEPTNAEKA